MLIDAFSFVRTARDTFEHFFIPMQVELSGRKIYAVNKAIPQLPISVEDAARSEAQIAEGEAVSLTFK